MTERMHVFSDAQGAAEGCARAIGARLNEAIAQRGTASLAVSGGSTPKLMFREMCQIGFDWSKIHLFWVDERVVPPDDDQSNYRMTRENLIVPGGLPENRVHRIRGEMEAVAAADLYRGAVEAILGSEPVFDVVQCGVGDDGHTASLFPGEPMVADRSGVVAALWVAKKHQWRVTLLPKPILAARSLYVLSSGADKANAVQSALQGPADPLGVPSQLLRGAEWFCDAAAVQHLA
ncbi:6-phosphogluconolactonase [uncultured Paludibaculum sp.]|uniref:6-phosphogluconolactonase n=1 Tax=uncultured Paludibaculum sp. TaxID=1765020 RepID=UPI002AABC67D|nr:6-phosphogluconolactonase [uncultured Paludibaculum sp.]